MISYSNMDIPSIVQTFKKDISKVDKEAVMRSTEAQILAIANTGATSGHIDVDFDTTLAQEYGFAIDREYVGHWYNWTRGYETEFTEHRLMFDKCYRTPKDNNFITAEEALTIATEAKAKIHGEELRRKILAVLSSEPSSMKETLTRIERTYLYDFDEFIPNGDGHVLTEVMSELEKSDPSLYILPSENHDRLVIVVRKPTV